ncbi:hypothetical protein sscle_04g038390 [Sclerotinia sclerotiorum 1980 UF-70]|uniref:Uncharacterized protein n=1 Tax=Sclerotinia sclerotiorum (strain ATCC 18683 / 1980 / Ss-1) TaxID=665079 RepID=A0A1D9Q2H9_SCLS1|nr:hypothetical protein sscle_04g038390 [Sclerotinia sclerotiorum 1980 UF-70]
MSTTLTTFPFEVLPIFEEVLVLEAVETPKIRCDLAALQFKFNLRSCTVRQADVLENSHIFHNHRPSAALADGQARMGSALVMLVRTQIVSHPEASKACRYSCCQPLIGKARMILKLDSFLT